MLLDQGLYEERYRLTGSIAASLAASVVMFGVAVHFSYVTWMALSVLAFVTITVPCPNRGGQPQGSPSAPTRWASRSAPNR